MHNIYVVLHASTCLEELGKFYSLCIALYHWICDMGKLFPLHFLQVVAHYCHRGKVFERILCTRRSPETFWQLWIIYPFKRRPANAGEELSRTFLTRTEMKNTWKTESKGGKCYLPWGQRNRPARLCSWSFGWEDTDHAGHRTRL